MKKDELKNVLRKAENRPPEIPGFYIQAIRVLILVLMAMAVGFSFYIKHAVSEDRDRADQIAQQRASFEAREKELLEEKDAREKTRLDAESLRIEDLRLTRVEGELTARGRIRNAGGDGVLDVELTVYLRGKDRRLLHTSSHTISSSDGRPLKKGQHRSFRIKVNPVPYGAEEVLVLVTGIEFEGGGKDYPLL